VSEQGRTNERTKQSYRNNTQEQKDQEERPEEEIEELQQTR
jgi:hypothetical protein